MRLENSTALETEWLRRVVEAVRPPGLDDFTIIYLPGNYLGSADGLLRVARVWVSAPLPEGAVAVQGRLVLRNLEEVLVQLTAHELYHLVQYDRGERATHRDPWQCRLERRANAYAARQVRRYRRFPFNCALSAGGQSDHRRLEVEYAGTGSTYR